MPLRGALAERGGVKQRLGSRRAAAPCGSRPSCHLLAAVPGRRLSSAPRRGVPGCSHTSFPWVWLGWRSPDCPQAHFQALLRWPQGSVTAGLWPGQQLSSPQCRQALTLSHELTSSMSGSVPHRIGDGRPCPTGKHFGALQPVGSSSPPRTGCVTAGPALLGPVPTRPAPAPTYQAPGHCPDRARQGWPPMPGTAADARDGR